MKTCARCRAVKPDTEFRKWSKGKDGLGHTCKDCLRISDRRDYTNPARSAAIRAQNAVAIERNQRYVLDYLLTHPCVDCGETDPIVLEFDHLGDKVATVNKLTHTGCSIATIQAEIDKCEVRCANDHRRKTAERHGGWYKVLNAVSVPL